MNQILVQGHLPGCLDTRYASWHHAFGPVIVRDDDEGACHSNNKAPLCCWGQITEVSRRPPHLFAIHGTRFSFILGVIYLYRSLSVIQLTDSPVSTTSAVVGLRETDDEAGIKAYCRIDTGAP